MKITKLICSPGVTGFFFDDQQAIKAGARRDGNIYSGTPVTEGFESVRRPGESISIGLILEDGQIAYGDCAAVQYSGIGGRGSVFLAKNFIPSVEKIVKPAIEGMEITTFKEMAAFLENLKDEKGLPLHAAIRYGVSQAILDAVAKSQHRLMAEVVAEEYGCTMSENLIPLFTQSGDDRFLNADKMILKETPILPHGLFNSPEKTGENGEKLLDYIQWLRGRIINFKLSQKYAPIIQLDLYGTLGSIFGKDYKAMANYLLKAEELAQPFTLYIEGPMDEGNLQDQIEALKKLREILEAKGSKVQIVADEWCNTVEDVKAFTDNKAGHIAQIKTPDLGGINNTIEAILYCRKNGMGAYLGGSCNETERSAAVCSHIAIATSPLQCLAKPGMGVDEGYMIMHNEMQRILAVMKSR
ncbi:MAG: methylaspartate ammonia-lyase [Defluviitaleaceae bacterium]|nr:methylaspartate ammonia-lyase [Defluviitaleaceae bacterium]